GGTNTPPTNPGGSLPPAEGTAAHSTVDTAGAVIATVAKVPPQQEFENPKFGGTRGDALLDQVRLEDVAGRYFDDVDDAAGDTTRIVLAADAHADTALRRIGIIRQSCSVTYR